MDDVLSVIHLPENITKDIGLVFDIKENYYGPPTSYLGAKFEPFHISDGKYSWSISIYTKMWLKRTLI